MTCGPCHDPEIVQRAEAVLRSIRQRHGQFQQMNLEPWGERWRLRYRRVDPKTGGMIRHAVLLQGMPAESTAMARYLEGRLSAAKDSWRQCLAVLTVAEAERKRIQTLLRKLRARVTAECRHGRRQRDEMGRAFDRAAELGPDRLEEFLLLRLWAQPSRQQRASAFEADFLRRHPFLKNFG